MTDFSPPRGFAAAYRGVAQSPATLPDLQSLLALVGYRVTLRNLAYWPPAKRVAAEVYAVRVHQRASDNPVRVPPRPAWLPDPWQGRAMPSRTVLP